MSERQRFRQCQICDRLKVHIGDDIACVDCRRDFTAQCVTVPDPVEQVLNHHWNLAPLSDLDSTLCRCGETIKGGPGFHRRHVAEKIYESLGLPGPEPWIPVAPGPAGKADTDG